MKSAMVYVLALSILFSALLSGCGEMRGTKGKSGVPTATPAQTLLPDPEDGEVRDRDGIITDEDSGALPGGPSANPEGSLKPDSRIAGDEKETGPQTTSPTAIR